jgi:hypothetical protein
MVATIAGAVLGGAAGYLFFTERGRALRRQFEPALDDFARELISFRQTVEKTAGIATQGWGMLNEAMDSGSQSSRYSNTRQTSPF